MTDTRTYYGKLRRQCAVCGVEVEITPPHRRLSADSTGAERKAAGREVAMQIQWEALCEGVGGCREWWKTLVLRVEKGHDKVPLPEPASAPAKNTFAMIEPHAGVRAS